MKKGLIFITLFTCSISLAQVFNFSTKREGKIINHRIMMDKDYLIETQFVSDPPEFILTRGGFYTNKGNSYEVALEFNSNFESDALKTLQIEPTESWKRSSKKPLDLNGKWLMAGRVTEEGERRRDTSKPRKTMKFLQNGYFQWIAFHTETFKFFGSGGGGYTAENQTYTEEIEFFSRNNKSVGRVLPFQYSVNGSDWHHKGKSSKGEPMHEIWTKRIY